MTTVQVADGVFPDVATSSAMPEGRSWRADVTPEPSGALRIAAPSQDTATHLLLPRLIEPHCHLDKCHTAARLGEIGGTLMDAILAQRADKARWTETDLRTRMSRGASELHAAGCKAARSHIDWSDDTRPPLAWHVADDIDVPDGLSLQWAALTSISQMADPDFATTVARTVSHKPGGVLGAFVLDHDPDEIRTGLAHMFAVADRFGLMLDFHVDEGLGDTNGLELIADAALDAKFEAPVLCGHAVSLMNRTPDDVARIADKLARAGISVCALPTTNLYLQDRGPGTPDRRGLTRLRELRNAGVAITVGSDNVADAFCPTGAHDPMAALNLAVLAGHLDPPLEDWINLITSDAAKALGLPAQTLAGSDAHTLLAYQTDTLSDVVSGRVPATALT